MDKVINEDPNDDIIPTPQIIEEDTSDSLQVISFDSLWNVNNSTILIAFEKNNNYAPTGTKSDPLIKEFFQNIDLWKSEEDDDEPNISWELETDITKAHIFVRFHDQSDSKSYVGSDAKKVLQNCFKMKIPPIPTMFISVEKTQFQRKCCHEFGHALGFKHGQIDPDFFQKLDNNNVSIPIQKEMKDHSNDVYDSEGFSDSGNFRTPFDNDSVMNYEFKQSMFKDEFKEEFKESLYQAPTPSIGDRKALADMYSPQFTKKNECF